MAKYTLAYFDEILKTRSLTEKEKKAKRNFLRVFNMSEEERERERLRLNAWRKANPEKTAAQAVRARQNRLAREPDFEREAARRWARNHPGYWSAWFAENAEKTAESQRRHRQTHPEKIRAHCRKRRARLMQAPGLHTESEIEALFERQKATCANPFCEKQLTKRTRQLDHIKALALGGSDSVENLQWLCRPCNSRKHAREVDEWLEREAVRAATLLGVPVDEVRAAFVADCQAASSALECVEISAEAAA